jgi:hypothetical protein
MTLRKGLAYNQEIRRRKHPLRVDCKFCGARAGERCVGKTYIIHSLRYATATESE